MSPLHCSDALPFQPRRERLPGQGCGCGAGSAPDGSAVCVRGSQGSLPTPGPAVHYSPGSANIGTTACP
ncbi:MAG: hypothetical protein IT210_26620 [Armatimonadetes bacterium]|nr:hypothetical protein [Armatimonadota bacterium]